MTRRRWMLLLASALALSTARPSDRARAEEPAAPASAGAASEAHVTYLATSTVYVDAGSDQGLAEGDLLEVVRNGAVIAQLRVFVVASHKAGCRREMEGAPIAVGDTVRYRPSTAATAPAVTTGTGGPSRAAAPLDVSQRLRRFGLSGRIGARYIMVRQPDADFSSHQPGLDLRLSGNDLGGSGGGVDVDVRAYRTYRSTGSGSSESESSNRVYRANVSWNPRTVPLHLVLGRQFSPSLATISIFDGPLAEYVGDGFSVGALAGTQPDPVNYGVNTDIREYGTYAELRNRVGAEQRWGATLGLIGSYDKTAINREFAYLQGRYNDRIAALYVAQEIDLNRGWKRDEGESTVSPTSTFAFGRLQAEEHVSIHAGYDNRRNVRLFRDHVTPVTEFDDRYRAGYWVGTDGRLGWARIGGEVRFARGGSGGSADAYSLTLGAVRVTPLRLDLRGRTTRYTSDRAEGWLHACSAGLPVADWIAASVNGGLRDETSRLAGGSDTQLGWYGLDIDVTLGRHWFFLVSMERTHGDGDNEQVYTALSYRL